MSHARVDGMTAPELAAHLSELVNDEEFVLKAVRLKFPQYGKEGMAHHGPRKRLTEEQARKSIKVSKADYHERNYTKPDDTVPWYDCSDSVKKNHADIVSGSDALLRAIHRAHPHAMQFAAKAGRQVVFP